MFEINKLPFSKKDLSPYISEQTMDFHYEKHHKGYCDKLNLFLQETDLVGKSIEDILAKISVLPKKIRDNAGGYFNHNFFWHSLAPKEISEKQNMGKKSEKKIIETFSSFEEFKKNFTEKALAVFGSGWIWLCQDQNNGLKIITTANQDNPLMDIVQEKEGNLKPLLALDLWEHAYYLDYQNRRADYVENFFYIINWQVLEERINK